MKDFVSSFSWKFHCPTQEKVHVAKRVDCSAADHGTRGGTDKLTSPRHVPDPLVDDAPSYRGEFMMGFDFHITRDGPKLIEINTNAGGFPSYVAGLESTAEQDAAYDRLVDSLWGEMDAFFSQSNVREDPLLAIVDDDVPLQPLAREMFKLASEIEARLQRHSVSVIVASAGDLAVDDERHLVVRKTGRRVHFVYNRIAPDFGLLEERHAPLRAAALAGTVGLSPHPSTFLRYADKRHLLVLAQEEALALMPSHVAKVVLPALNFDTNVMSEEEWRCAKKQFVVKPVSGCGSRGVYRGDRFSNNKLKCTLQAVAAGKCKYIAQRAAPPSRHPLDDTPFDVRLYSCGGTVLGLVARHYGGQVMEQTSDKSGFRRVLPVQDAAK